MDVFCTMNPDAMKLVSVSRIRCSIYYSHESMFTRQRNCSRRELQLNSLVSVETLISICCTCDDNWRIYMKVAYFLLSSFHHDL